MKVKIIDEQCIACGQCEAIEENVFGTADVAYVKVDEVPKELEENVIDASESCPTSAIEIIKED